MRDATRVVHAGLPPAVDGEPLLPGPAFAAPFHQRGEVEGAPWHGYGRDGNPTWALYEAALGELEDASAVLFPNACGQPNARPRLPYFDRIARPVSKLARTRAAFLRNKTSKFMPT